MLRTYRTCNSTVRFSKYELNNKLLGDVTLLIITPGVTWTQPFIYIYKGRKVLKHWTKKKKKLIFNLFLSLIWYLIIFQFSLERMHLYIYRVEFKLHLV